MNEDFTNQISTTDISILDHLIVSTIPFSTVDQIYQKANEDNLDKPRFSRSFIEEQINSLLFTPMTSHIFLNSKFSFDNLPLNEEEDFMIILLSKFQKETNASLLCTKYRYLFNFNHPFSSLVSQIEQNLTCNFTKQSSVVEAYATTFAQLERIYKISEFSQEEFENAQITEEDMDFIHNSSDYVNDKSIIDYKSQTNISDSTYPIEEIESDFLSLTQMYLKIFAFLQTKEISVPIIYKNFLIGDSDLSDDVDYNLKSMEEYRPVENELALALIMLKNDLNFYLENVGASIIIVDGFQIYPGEITNLNNNCLLEISGCDFVFSINFTFMNKLKEVALQIVNQPELNHEDTIIETENQEKTTV